MSNPYNTTDTVLMGVAAVFTILLFTIFLSFYLLLLPIWLPLWCIGRIAIYLDTRHEPHEDTTN